MFRNRCIPVIIMILFVLMLSGCMAQSSDPAGALPAPTENTQPTPVNPQATEPPKQASWVIEVNDTKQYTDELGIIWNYTLTLYASKPGGTNVTGEYLGEANLKIEPDIGTVQTAAASEGTTLLSMIFNYYADCESLSFVVEKFDEAEYAAEQTEFNKNAGLQSLETGENMDFFAFGDGVFNATQEPVTMTIQTEKGPKTGSGGGGGATVDVPIEISIEGATAYIFIYNLPQPLGDAFKGTVTGDVLPS